MNFDDYQKEARRTDVSAPHEDQIIVPLLGLAGECGSLLTEYKKRYRDGKSYLSFNNSLKEELGDILWYLSTVASREDLSLSEIAAANLDKNVGRWDGHDPDRAHISSEADFYDTDYPPDQQLPRTATYTVRKSGDKAAIFFNEHPYNLGDRLTDNNWRNDGYMFHDVFHIAFSTILHWSPISRRLLNAKRRSQPDVDNIEDGGRAGIIEEAIVAVAFDHASKYDFYKDVTEIDAATIDTARKLTASYEVRSAAPELWYRAFKQGFEAWNLLQRLGEGIILTDANERTITFRKLCQQDQPNGHA